jgi:AcrR family transcriptional regulator
MSVSPRLKRLPLIAEPISGAVLATIHERGYAKADVEEFVRRAGMSREEFDLRFSGKDDITARILEAHLDLFVVRVGRAYVEVEGWPGNLRAAAYEALRCIGENPDMAWFVTVGILEAGEMTRALRDQALGWAATLVDAGRALSPDPTRIPRAASVMAVGAFFEALRRRQVDGREPDLAKSLPGLMYSAVRPYLGEEAARRELMIELSRGQTLP